MNVHEKKLPPVEAVSPLHDSIYYGAITSLLQDQYGFADGGTES